MLQCHGNGRKAQRKNQYSASSIKPWNASATPRLRLPWFSLTAQHSANARVKKGWTNIGSVLMAIWVPFQQQAIQAAESWKNHIEDDMFLNTAENFVKEKGGKVLNLY